MRRPAVRRAAQAHLGSRGSRRWRDPRVALGEQERRRQDAEIQAFPDLPKRALLALKAHKRRQAAEREAAGEAWHDSNLVFCHEDGSMYTRDALNWRFSKMTRRAGIGHWHAHEGRHTACRS
jgi:hypothetical protein